MGSRRNKRRPGYLQELSQPSAVPKAWVHSIEIGWLGVIASKPAPTTGIHTPGKLVGYQAAIASKPAPTAGIHTLGKLVGCQAAIVGKPAPTAGIHTLGKWVGCQAAIASKPAPTDDRRTPTAFPHSTGRALARLQLLILIHPPPRQAEWRRLSGGGRAAPCGEDAHIERRSSRSRPEAMPPDECRSEGTPSPSEGPYERGERFLLTFLGACKKVSRRKGETISRRYRSNGYVLNHPSAWSAQRPPRSPSRLPCPGPVADACR